MRYDGEMPLTFKELYQRDRAEYIAELKNRLLIPEYKGRKLWRLNYSIADIEAGKHFEQFPSWNYANRPEIKTEAPYTRGRALSRKRVEWYLVRAMRIKANEILAGYSMVAADREWLKELIIELENRQKKLTAKD